MAAHIVTALKELQILAEIGQASFEQIQAALDLSTWTEDIDFEDYRDLQEITKKESQSALAAWCKERLENRYLALYAEYGNPRTRAEWILAWANKIKSEMLAEKQE